MRLNELTLQAFGTFRLYHLYTIFLIVFHRQKLWNNSFFSYAYALDDIEIKGEIRKYTFCGGSGNNLNVCFCPRCTTKLYIQPELIEGMIYIPCGILKEYFDDKPLKKKLVAAYLIGANIKHDEFNSIQPMYNAEETGGFVNWNSYKKNKESTSSRRFLVLLINTHQYSKSSFKP